MQHMNTIQKPSHNLCSLIPTAANPSIIGKSKPNQTPFETPRNAFSPPPSHRKPQHPSHGNKTTRPNTNIDMLNVQAFRNKHSTINDIVHILAILYAFIFTQYGRHAVQRSRDCAHKTRAHRQLNMRLVTTKHRRHWGKVE